MNFQFYLNQEGNRSFDILSVKESILFHRVLFILSSKDDIDRDDYYLIDGKNITGNITMSFDLMNVNYSVKEISIFIISIMINEPLKLFNINFKNLEKILGFSKVEVLELKELLEEKYKPVDNEGGKK